MEGDRGKEGGRKRGRNGEGRRGEEGRMGKGEGEREMEEGGWERVDGRKRRVEA
jgi:hypothetical protein